MSNTWILVANRSGAKFYERRRGSHDAPSCVREIEHPEGRLKNQEIDSDRSGRAFERLGRGGHAMNKENAPTKHEAELFAKQIAAVLDEAAHTHAFDDLVLVSDPSLLGMVRDHLSDSTSSKIKKALSKNLVDVTPTQLEAYLEGL